MYSSICSWSTTSVSIRSDTFFWLLSSSFDTELYYLAIASRFYSRKRRAAGRVRLRSGACLLRNNRDIIAHTSIALELHKEAEIMISNIEKLAEELAALDSLRQAGITTELSKVPGEGRIYFGLPYEHTTAFFEFAEILPYHPDGADGAVSDLCKGNGIQVFSDLAKLTRAQAKGINREVYTYLYFIFYDAANAGKISSKVMAGTKFPESVLREREIEKKRIETEFKNSPKDYLTSLDPRPDLKGAPGSHEGVKDGGGLQRRSKKPKKK